MAEALTVIVVALLGGEALDSCVAAARSQCSALLAINRDGTIVDANGRAEGRAGRLDIPAKRRSGIELAETPLVALLEDIVIPGAGWAAAVVDTLGRTDAVACGGPVAIADGLPAATRALALSEYGGFDERARGGRMDALPGCNFAFQRQALVEAMEGSDGLVDSEVFRRLKAMGELVWAPGMAVTFAHPWSEGARLKTRFDHGRIYGSSASGLGRVLTAAKAALLPAVLTVRSLRRASRFKASTLGWLVLQHSAWAAGELVGALLGPGKGLRGWR